MSDSLDRPERLQRNEAIYAAIGRFIVAFSQMQLRMEVSITNIVGRTGVAERTDVCLRRGAAVA